MRAKDVDAAVQILRAAAIRPWIDGERLMPIADSLHIVRWTKLV